MQKQETPKKKAPTFEEALAELEQIVTQMENGQLSLEESVERYTRGMELTKICRKKLSDAETRIRKLEADGRLTPLADDSEAPAPKSVRSASRTSSAEPVSEADVPF